MVQRHIKRMPFQRLSVHSCCALSAGRAHACLLCCAQVINACAEAARSCCSHGAWLCKMCTHVVRPQKT